MVGVVHFESLMRLRFVPTRVRSHPGMTPRRELLSGSDQEQEEVRTAGIIVGLTFDYCNAARALWWGGGFTMIQ